MNRKGGHEMRSRFSKTMLVLTTPLLIAALGGCVWRTKEVREVDRDKGSTVVTAPPSGPVVMSQGATPTAPPPPTVSGQTDRVMYQEGRWQLYGDGRTMPYYWVWIPTGASLTSTPMPPPRPTGVVARSNQVVTYPEGRWQLYGDGQSTQYYWVWIPSGVTPPNQPLPPQAG